MKAFQAIVALATILSLLTPYTKAYGDVDDDARGYSHSKTLFVVELLRHGARSHFESNVNSNDFFGVPKGHLTKKGWADVYRIGNQRRNQYVYG